MSCKCISGRVVRAGRGIRGVGRQGSHTLSPLMVLVAIAALVPPCYAMPPSRKRAAPATSDNGADLLPPGRAPGARVVSIPEALAVLTDRHSDMFVTTRDPGAAQRVNPRHPGAVRGEGIGQNAASDRGPEHARALLMPCGTAGQGEHALIYGASGR